MNILLASRNDDLYGTGRVALPTPVYIVFYNGSEMQTDNLMLYLSDSFSAGRGSGCLECTCEVLNINRGYNQALMEKCHRLWEYSEFSSEIEENIKSGMRRKEAIHTAIDTCIEKGILKDILIRQKAEVLPLLNSLYHPAIRNHKTDTGDCVPYLTQSPEVSRSSTPPPAPSL